MYADPLHVYRVARKWCWSRRESHSINTPRCLLRLHPQKRRCTPSIPPLSFLSFSFSFSLLFTAYTPLLRGQRIRPPPRKGTIRWKRAFGWPKTREGNTLLSRIFRRILADSVKKSDQSLFEQKIDDEIQHLIFFF